MSATTQREAEVKLTVDSEQAEGKLRDLKKRLVETRKEYTEMFKKGDTSGMEKAEKRAQRLSGQIRKMQTNAQNVADAMASLDRATPRQLQQTIKSINNELNSGRIPRGTKEWNDYVQKLKQVQGELNKVNAEMRGVQTAQGGFLSGFADTFTKWWGTYTILTQAIDGVNLKLSAMRKDMRDKDESRANLKALTGLDDESIQWLTEQAEKLSTTMDDTGLRVTQSSKDILEAYMLVGSNKPELLTDKEALNAVTVETMRLSAAAKMNLKDAVDATTTALNQYGAGADEAAKYVNVLAAGSKFGAANVQQQAAAILKAGTAAAMAEVPIEQLVGVVETLGEKGTKGEIAGTALKKFFLTLQSGAEATNPKVVGLETALENLKKKVDDAEKKGAGKGAAFLKKMFGEEGFSAAAIITQNIEQFKYYTNAVTGTSTAIEQAAINSDTLAAKKAQLRNKMKEVGIELMEKLNPSLGVLVSWQTKLISCLPGLIDFIAKNRTVLLSLAAAYAGYLIYVKGAAAWTLIHNKYIAVSTALQATYTATTKLCAAAWYTMTGNTIAARNAMAGFNAACASNPVGAVVAVLLAAGAALWYFASKAKDASASQKALNDIKKKGADNAAKEVTKINMLVEAAKNEKLSLEERKKAVDKLNEIIPDYNAKLDDTTGKYEENKKALDEYIRSLVRKYEIEAAEGELAEIGKSRMNLNRKLARANDRKEKAEAMPDTPMTGMYQASVGVSQNASNNRTLAIRTATNEVAALNKELAKLEELEKEITGLYGEDLQKKAIETATQTGGGGGGGGTVSYESEEERKAREKREREELKKALDEKKAIYEKSRAEILALYSTGDIDYRTYMEKMNKADEDYIIDRKSVYEQQHKEESSEYASLLREQEQLKQKHLDKMHKLDEKDLQTKRDAAADMATANYLDPDSAMFQNKKALDEKLLEADVEYLQARIKLFNEGSEERQTAEEQLEKRLADARKQKQRQTAEAYMQFLEQYGKASGSLREKMELSSMDELHNAGLISEEQYQKAIHDIKHKYLRQDKDKAKDDRKKKREERWADFDDNYNPANEFDRMAADVGKSWVNLIEGLKDGSDFFWEDFTAAAASSFAIVSAGLSQVSGYMQACQDAEIAAIENKYDKEIEAAGKNSRKAAKLEKQKEQEVAKVKKKYNDRAMKMEIAQAIAQTAMNALGAFGAMVEIPVVGPALAAAAAAMATAAGMIQIATIKKQHEAQAQGYYSGGFTSRDPDNRKEVGVVHANEFVANHNAVSNPQIAPVLQLIDRAQKSNTVGSLTADDVTNALGRNQGVSARGEEGSASAGPDGTSQTFEMVAGVVASQRQVLDRLATLLEGGLSAYMVMDGEQGFDNQYKRYKKSINRTRP